MISRVVEQTLSALRNKSGEQLLSAAYTASRVSPAKVVWGVGVYGYDWGLDPSNNWDNQHAEYRSFAESTALATGQGAQSGYDPTYQAPWVLYPRNGQTRVIWYENARSFAASAGSPSPSTAQVTSA